MTAPHSPSPPTRPDVAVADEPSDAAKDASTRLSFTQVAASGLAAVSATVLMSFFGVAGTIIGAGLASVATVVGNFLYTRSIEKTQAQLKAVASKPGLRPRTVLAAVGTKGTASVGRTTTGTLVETTVGDPTAEDGATGDTPPGEGSEDADAPPPRNRWLRLIDRHGKVKVLTVSALALFVVVMGLVLALELAIGKPISDAVRGQEGSGTSISATRDRGSETDDPAGTSDTEQRDATGDRSGTDGQDQQEQAPDQEAPADDPANVPDADPTTPPSDGTEDGSTDTGTEGTDGTDGSGDTGDADTGGVDPESDTGSGDGTSTDPGSGDSGGADGSSGSSGGDGDTSTGESGSGSLGGTVEDAPAS